MIDSYHRPITYLRISVTDHCNLRCVYCMPPEGTRGNAQEALLTDEEIIRVAQAAARLGVRRVRLTGGEPLVRAGLPGLVSVLAKVPGIEEVSLTTNGVLLGRMAQALASAGLRRVNVSLDTLSEERFQHISRVGRGIERILDGIRIAERHGLAPIKINAVVARGVNDDEVASLARLTLSENWHVRFIELMPVGQCATWDEARFVPAAEMKTRLEAQVGPLTPAASPGGCGPANYFRLPQARATVGFITSVSRHFCRACNRLRLTADGKLRPCLLSDAELDLRAALRSGVATDDLCALIQQAAALKPAGHRLAEHSIPLERVMAQIGG